MHYFCTNLAKRLVTVRPKGVNNGGGELREVMRLVRDSKWGIPPPSQEVLRERERERE